MRLDELAGSVDVNPAHAAALIKTLFDPHDILTITGKKARRGVGQNLYTQRLTASELITQLSGPDATALLYEMCTSPEPLDMYFGLSPVKPGTDRGVNKRVKDDDVALVKLLYADLDVKPGSFNSQQEAINFLRSLPFKPNVVVSSGSGGLHAYWRISGIGGMQGVNTIVGKDLLTRWWAYLSENSHGRKIDQLIDVTRMSRLPGTIRWPHPDTDEVPRPVEILHHRRDEIVTPAQVYDLTEGAWQALQERRKQVRRRNEQLSTRMKDYSELIGGGKWSDMYAVASAPEWVNEHMPWASILQPLGWTYLRTDSDGREEWARPGRNAKSATVNWPESPHVMSLLSTSEETGLFDLHDADIPLTKWRCLLRLYFNDNMDNALEWVLYQMRNTPTNRNENQGG